MFAFFLVENAFQYVYMIIKIKPIYVMLNDEILCSISEIKLHITHTVREI